MPTVIPVRTHFNIQDLWFDPGDSGAGKGDHVLVSTERGTEIGLVTADPFSAPKDEVKGDLKHVMRVATEADLERAEQLAQRGEEAMPVFRQLVKESGLDMKPVGVEFLFGGEKVVFYFAAEDRVDFRDLVRDLASHFKQRVDMRQIGVRDEARLVGGYAPCGQELCCVRFGGEFEPVSIRMAKEQDLPLNSSKISGVCGRLMCCLRYEFEAYRDFKQRAPKKNAVIETPLGKAKIVEYNTPRETLTLRLENGKSFVIALASMTCSEGCCKRAAEQHTPLRPDTVTREALEELGTPDIVMQLAELDRANGEVGYVLDDSLLDTKRTPRRRNQAEPGEAAKKPGQPEGKRARGGKGDEAQPVEQGRKPRRRAAAPEAAEAAPEAQQPVRRSRRGRPLPPEPSPEQAAEAKPENAEGQRRQPRGGGMKPRRSNRTAEKQQGETAQQQRPERAKAASGAPEAQPTRRTRRHHVAAADGAAPVERTENQAQQAPGKDQQQRPRRQRRQRQAAQGEPGGEQQPKQEQQPRQPRQRRQRQGAQDTGQQGVSARQAGQDGAQQGERKATRRRRPGDKGGAAAAPQAE